MPWHRSAGSLRELHIYSMPNVKGVSVYLARSSLYKIDCFLLRQTLTDFARYVVLIFLPTQHSWFILN